MIKNFQARVLPWRSIGTRSPLRNSIRARRTFATVSPHKERDPTELDRITRLPNGIRVATEALSGHFSAVGVYIDAGSRYENDELRGVSHIVDRLAFKSTSKRSADDMLENLESLGGNMQCASSRETMMYQSATFNDSVQKAVELLAETIRDPLILDEEVQQQLETADYEIGEIWSKPELILPELVHVAAYKDNTLGNPLLCPRERLSEIDRSKILMYRNTFYNPDRMVVAFAGVEHETALRMAEKYFGDMRGSQSQLHSRENQHQNGVAEGSEETFSASKAGRISGYGTESKLVSRVPLIKNLSTAAAQHANIVDPNFTNSNGYPTLYDLSAPARYTGGYLSLPAIPPPPNPALPRLSYIHVAFEAFPIASQDIYALATLQTLLGGGGSFSAGGPGKGMYSRLYTNVLNQYYWCDSCAAFNHSYTDSGLFGISASCSPDKSSQMLEVICRELAALCSEGGHNALKQDEVERAKNQLRSSLLMNLESRMVELEDLGRQVQMHGSKIGVKEMCSIIDNLTVEDLRRVARVVVKGLVENKGQGSGAPTVVIQEGEEEGKILKPFQWGEIQERIARWHLGRI